MDAKSRNAMLMRKCRRLQAELDDRGTALAQMAEEKAQRTNEAVGLAAKMLEREKVLERALAQVTRDLVLKQTLADAEQDRSMWLARLGEGGRARGMSTHSR